MKFLCCSLLLRAVGLALTAGMLAAADSQPPGPVAAAPDKVRVLLITGGHGFEQPQFFQLFRNNPEITLTLSEHPHADAMLKAEPAKGYDVIVLYDMQQDISEDAKTNFIARLKEGKGLVVLH